MPSPIARRMLGAICETCSVRLYWNAIGLRRA